MKKEACFNKHLGDKEERIIGFCKKIGRKVTGGTHEEENVYRATSLDLIQTTYMEKHVPIVYCYMTFNAKIDIARLKKAVQYTAKIVPQILCRYNDRKNRWYPTAHDADSVVKVFTENNHLDNFIWDLQSDTQLKINIYRQREGDNMQICMSHILADGSGLKQYLALLCESYNNQYSDISQNGNYRSIDSLLYRIPAKRIRCGHRRLQKGNASPFLPGGSAVPTPRSLKIALVPFQMESIRERVKALDITLNDLFMTAYVFAIKKFITQDEIVIPCPVDLRKFNRRTDQLTIANMTGKYLCHVQLAQEKGFAETALAIHKEMEGLKSKYDCLKMILPLQMIYAIFPPGIVRRISKQWYSIEPISYTNIGVIDQHKVFFDDAPITDCYLCGTYRQAPSFQVSISTFKNTCTLSSNMLCSENQSNIGMQVLETMSDLLLYSA